MKRTTLAGILALALAAQSAASAVLLDETISATSPVIEPDWKRVLAARVEEAGRLGLFEQKRREALETMRERADHFTGRDLPRATRFSSRSLELLTAGQREQLSGAARLAIGTLRRTYILADTRREDECLCARQALEALAPARIVVMAGPLRNPPHLSDVRLYADQNAVLARRFSIAALPSIVSIEGTRATVFEIPAGRQGCREALALLAGHLTAKNTTETQP